MPRDRLARLDSFHAAQVLGELARSVGRVPRGMELVVIRALNRAITATRDEATSIIRETYAAPARDVKQTMFISKATRAEKVAMLKARGRMSIPLIRWNARQTKKGVTVIIRKGEGRKLVTNSKKGTIATFIAKGHVFARPEHAARTNIRRLYGPSFLAVLREAETQPRLQARAEDVFRTRVLAEANHLLSKVKA